MSAKEKMYENVLKLCLEEYSDKINIFNSLDSKAQQVIAFSGVLLGFLISFCKKETLEFLNEVNPFSIILCIVSISLLLGAISLSILSMRIIKLIGMPTYEEIKMEYLDLKEINEKDYKADNYYIFINNRIELWESTLKNIFTINKKKAKKVFLAQILCGCGLITLGFIGFIILCSYLKFY